jgi:hypothetical protein
VHDVELFDRSAFSLTKPFSDDNLCAFRGCGGKPNAMFSLIKLDQLRSAKTGAETLQHQECDPALLLRQVTDHALHQLQMFGVALTPSNL